NRMSPSSSCLIFDRYAAPSRVAGVTCQVAPRFQPVAQLSPSISATPSPNAATPDSAAYGTAFENVAVIRWKLTPAPTENWSLTFHAMLGFRLIACTSDSIAWKRPTQPASHSVPRPNGTLTPRPTQSLSG